MIMTDVEQALNDELARIRAREKRFKDAAEAQIVHLQEQLTIFQTKIREADDHISNLETLVEAQKSECQKLEKKTILLQQEKESLQSQLAAVKAAEAQAHKDQTELAWTMHRTQELEQENIQLQKQLLELQGSQYAMDEQLTHLQAHSSELEKMVRCYGELLQKYPQLERFMKKAQYHSLVRCINTLFSTGKH